MLETERLILRRWEESDAESLFQYAKDPDVGPIAGWPPHQSVEESLDVIRTVFNGPEAYAICLKTDNKAIGAIELKLNGHTDMTERDDECELGYWLGKPFWVQGIVPEAVREMLRHAFEDIGMQTLLLGIFIVNSLKVILVLRHNGCYLNNPDIANVFYRAGYIETWGQGIQKICDECIALGAELPRYEILGTGIRVYFPALKSALIAQPKTPNRQDVGKYFVADLQKGIRDDLYERPTKASPEYFIGKTLVLDGNEFTVSGDQGCAIYRYLIKNDYIDEQDHVTDAMDEAGTFPEIL